MTLLVAALRTLLESSPTILGGVAVASYLRTQWEPEQVRSSFRGEGYAGILRAALIGTLLPVCSIGVLPVLRELRRLGLPTEKLLALGIAAPLLNPLALIYGVSVLSSFALLAVFLAAGIAAIVLGDVGSRFSCHQEVTSDSRPAGLTGFTRLRNLFVAASRFAAGATLIDLAIVIASSGFAVSLLPSGAFYHICESGKVSGPAIASVVSFPQYVSPLRGVIQFAGISNANLSTATGLAIYAFGTGISVASLVTLIRWYGFRRVLALMLAFFLVLGGFVYVSFVALPAPIAEVAETSALDGMTRPSAVSFSEITTALKDLVSFFDPFVLLSTATFAFFVCAGFFFRIANVELRDDDPEAAAAISDKRMSKAMPASQLGAVTIAGIGLLFLLFMYVYFPPPKDVMADIDNIQLDANIAIRGGKIDVAVEQISKWDSAVASIPIAAAIRGAFPSPTQRELTRSLRVELYRTQELLAEGDLNLAKERIAYLMQLQTQTKQTFLEDAP